MRPPFSALALRALSVAVLAASLTARSQTTSLTTGSATAASPTSEEPAYLNPANWDTIKPVETDNIVFATVSRVPNPSAAASPDPGTPNGIRRPVPNTGPAGTLDLHVDVYQVSSAKPTPVVVQIHGGGWIRGDRPSSYRSFGSFFAAGVSVVTVQYRNAKDAPAPGAIQDVRCALAWVKRNAAKYNFDANRVVTWGGSAGGHLALMAAYAPASFNRPGCTDQPHVAAVIDMYGPTNLVDALSQHGSSGSVHQWLGMDLPIPRDAARATPATGAALPGAAPEPSNPGSLPPSLRTPRWPAPDAKLISRAREMSPMTYIHPGLPPTFIINGDSDPSVDPSQDAQLKKALDATGVPNGQYIVVGGRHGNFPPAENQKSMLLSLQFLRVNGVLH
jgi:acetyl esterase/lipase